MALITITSYFGSGGENIARLVSERLGIELFDNNKIKNMIISAGMSKKDIEELDEKSPDIFYRLFNNKPGLYMDLLGSIVYDIASRGEGVVVGHGAQLFLKNFNCAFHVMIHASEQTRSNTIKQEQNIDELAAKKIIREMDKRFNRFVHYAFNRDMNDLSTYDVVINQDKINSDIAAKSIADISKSERIKTCSINAIQEMQYSALESKIHAELLKNNITSPFTQLFVDVNEKGDAYLSGTTFSEEEKSKIIKIVTQVPGVGNVMSDVLVHEFYD